MLIHNVSTTQSTSSISTENFHAKFSSSCVSAKYHKDKGCVGVEVENITEKTPSTLMDGDIIIDVNGIAISQPTSLFHLLRTIPINKIYLRVIRGEKRIKVTGSQVTVLIQAVRSQPIPPQPPTPPPVPNE